MAIFLIFVLGIVGIVLWGMNRDRTQQLRERIEGLESQINALRGQVVALARAAAASQASASVAVAQAPVSQARVADQPIPKPESPAAPIAPHEPPMPAIGPAFEQEKPAAATHASTPQAADFTPAWKPPISEPPAPVSQPILPAAQVAQPRVESTRPRPATAPPTPWSTHVEPPESTSASRILSLEERLGSNWLNKLGIAILVIGIAFFLAYKLETWGPAGKVFCGFAVSTFLLAGGVWLERKPTYRIFARGGIGGGWALAYFTTFAMHHLAAARVLDSLAADLVLMLLVAAGMVAHSLRYKSQAVTGLAFLLAFGTLLTSDLEATTGTVVFSLTASAILAIALVVVTTMRHWAWLELAGLAAVYINHLVWLMQVLPANHAAFADFWPSTALILLYWLIFRLAYVFRTPLDQKEETISSLSAVLNSTGVLGLLKFQSAHPEWAAGALAVLGVAEMLLAFRVRSRRRQAFVVLSTIASVLLVAAVPFRFHGVSWPVLWLVEAQVLALSGLRLGEPVFRRLGLLAGVITGAVLTFHDVLPLFLFRLDFPDSGKHVSLIVALTLAAILYWVHAEVYPRRWPRIVGNELETLALRLTSWLGVAAGAAALWVALPDLWLPVGWLALVLLLGIAGRRFGAERLGFEADVLALGAGAVLLFHHILPLALFRLDNADPGRHPAETAALAIAALCFWVHAEALPRIFSRAGLDPATSFESSAWPGFVLPMCSFLGTVTAAAALWVALPAPWVVVGWLALMLLLGLAADWLSSESFAVEADILAIAALIGLAIWDLGTTGWWDHQAPIAAAVALLYAGMRRRNVAAGLGKFVPVAYSWAATLVLAYLAADASSVVFVGAIWATLGLALFEVGRFFRKGFLRWQGYLLVALAFARYFLVDLPDLFGNLARPQPLALYADHFSLTNSLLLEVLVLASAGYWLLERTTNRDSCTRREHLVGLGADAFGSLSIALWFAYRFPSYWVPASADAAWVTVIWAGMATVLAALALLMRRRAFLVQAVALAVAVVLRGFAIDLPADAPAGFWHGPLFHLSVAAAILLAALPFAFRLRGKEFWQGASVQLPETLEAWLRRPEQWFFFAPFALELTALAVKLSSGHITIAWSLLGLGVFLFALAVGERSYRMAGLSLFMLCVAKILLMDLWRLTLPERYTTLIVLGAALSSVSFLYARYSSVIRKFL
jgi:hypothetical protein